MIRHVIERADTTTLENALAACTPAVARLLEKALLGRELSVDDGIALFEARGADLDALLCAADAARRRAVGDAVSFVITRNINFTNVCYMGCRFCNFGKGMDDPEAEFMTIDEVVKRAQEAKARGATEVCLQGGLHPKMGGAYYLDLVSALHEQVPELHLHAFSPFEIWFGARLLKQEPVDFLRELKERGLSTIPGTAAEILDTEIRLQLSQNKLPAGEWVRIVKAAHGLGIRSTATIMYGHVDAPRHWAAHLALVRDIQKETGGFTEFVPLGFVHYKTRLFLEFGARPGPTHHEHLKMHAVSRLMLNGWVDNIQVSWAKVGPALAGEMLNCGVNDLGGTLMNESITRAAGGTHGQEITPEEMVELIRSAGRIPVRRNTLYDIVETYHA
jgi:FO synthase